jgi:hypothetical protein
MVSELPEPKEDGVAKRGVVMATYDHHYTDAPRGRDGCV